MSSPVLTVTLNPAIDLHLAVEEWPREDMARAAEVRRAAGGKGVNVARVLGELGVAAEAFCLVGDTPDSAVFLSLLAGLPFTAAPFEIPGALRTNVTLTRLRDGRRLKVNQPGPTLTPALWRRVETAIGALLPGRRWLVLSGALPPGAPADAYARLARLAHRQHVAVALDCAGPALLAALPQRPDLIKPNREELSDTLGAPCRSRRAITAAARDLQRRGAGWVIVSGGGAECLAFTDAEAFRAQPPAIKAGNPMGGGDSLLAGFLAGIISGQPFPEALRLGLAAGAATAARPNTLFCTRAGVMKLKSQVRLIG